MVEQLNAGSEARGMTDTKAGQLRMELELSPKSIHHAKRIAMESVRLWGADEDSADVGLTVAELLTNVLQHALPADGRETKVATCLVQRVPGGIAVVVHDDDSTPPVLRVSDHESLGGRGLQLISALATHFSVAPSFPGKDVTALFLRGRETASNAAA